MMMTVKSLSALALSHQGPIAGEKKHSTKKCCSTLLPPTCLHFHARSHLILLLSALQWILESLIRSPIFAAIEERKKALGTSEDGEDARSAFVYRTQQRIVLSLSSQLKDETVIWTHQTFFFYDLPSIFLLAKRRLISRWFSSVILIMLLFLQRECTE